MRCISGALDESLHVLLPETHRILVGSRLTIHDAVRKVVLSGSRGPKGGFRPGSDIDLSLIVDRAAMQHAGAVDVLLGEVIGTTLGTWEGEVDCEFERPDCMGLFKTQKGFNGRVPDIGLLIADAYPMITIWSEGP